MTSLLVTPLDVVKVRMQAMVEPPPMPSNVAPCPKGCGTFVLNNGQLECVLPKSVASFFDKSTGRLTDQARQVFVDSTGKTPSRLGTFSMLRRIFRKEGFGGIYAGIRPTLVMAVPNTVLYFSAYEEMVWRLRSKAGDCNVSTNLWLIPLVSGASARVAASSVTAPFEFLRTRQASMVGGGSNQHQSRGLVSDFGTIIRNEGFGALYSGLRSTLWRDVPFSAVYWLCLERLREAWKERSDHVKPSPAKQAMQAFLNGAISGMIAAACTTPFDVVKTRQQQYTQAAATAGQVQTQITASTVSLCSHDGAAVYEHAAGSGGGRSSRRSTGTFAHLRQIARDEGVQGLWRGNQARMLKVAPACAIMISSYELGKRLLEE